MQAGKQEVTKVVSLVKMAENLPGVSSPLKAQADHSLPYSGLVRRTFIV